MSSVGSEDRARCPILSCGTYLMLERTGEGTRAGEEGGREREKERERESTASSVLCTRFLEGAWRWDPRSLGIHCLPRAARLCKNIGRPIWRVFLARRQRRLVKLGWVAAFLASWWPPFVCVSTLIASLLGLLARSLSPHVLHLLETVSGCQAARASAAQRTRLRTGVIYIASTWGPCAVASDFSRVLPGRKQEALCSRQ